MEISRTLSPIDSSVIAGRRMDVLEGGSAETHVDFIESIRDCFETAPNRELVNHQVEKFDISEYEVFLGRDDGSVVFNPITQEYIHYVKAPSMENLVISGGGAKGVILPGAIKALEERAEGVSLSPREQLRNIAGSSVGAISAALIATGVSAEELNASLSTIKFKDLLKDSSAVKKFKYPHMSGHRAFCRSLRHI